MHKIMANNSIKNKKEVVTLSKSDFLDLKHQAQAYQFLVAKVFELPLKDPVGKVVEDFKKTGLYTKEFLQDFESGLRKSSYIKKYGN